ncbi:MAG TPA: hypothetical protein VFV71_01855 [Burkholderiales bacterium]|nr:hypothetical protein [Burkholderiales bacterium]
MNLLAARPLDPRPAPARERALAISLDVARAVVTAALAGTVFALLLALAVLSLTVVAPPAQASGAPVATSDAPGNAPEMAASAAEKPAAPIHLAAVPARPQDPAVQPAQPAAAAAHAEVYESLHGSSRPLVLYLLAGIAAALAGFAVYSLSKKRKS